MNAAPRVSLVMPNYDNGPVLDLVLERLAANTDYPNLELIVVDDGSTDESLEIVRRWRETARFPELRLIEREHAGVVAALNTGLEAATGEVVVQLDGDASVETPGWVEEMLALLLSDDRIGVVTAKVVLESGRIHACGMDVIGPEGLHDRGTEITEPVGQRTYHQRVLRPRDGHCDACARVAEVDGGMGCCMMYRRELALDAGGYDPGFAPVWFDDLDLTLSIRRRGAKVFFHPGVRVIHRLNMRRAPRIAAWRRAVRATQRRAGALLPERMNVRLLRALDLDRPPHEHQARLEHHYAYWREKWGFDILNPDMDAVRERWGETEICWRSNPEMRQAGEQIAVAYQAGQRARG